MARVTTLSISDRSTFEHLPEHAYLKDLPEGYEKKYSIGQVEVSDLPNLFPSVGNVGVIVNTVSSAKNLYIELSSKGFDVSLHHSQFLTVDRLQADRRLIALLGKKANNSETLRIFVGTQVMEESLDIDFDLLITEICPMDKLLQRMGRLHRHSWKKRPIGFENPQVYILYPDEENVKAKGSKVVYGDYPLIQTERILRRKSSITLPADIERLIIESSLPPHSESEISSEEENKLAEAYIAYSNLVDSKKTAARTFLLGRPKGKPASIFGWLQGPLSESRTSEEQGAAKVRDGVSGIEVLLLFTDDEGQFWVPYYLNGERQEYHLKNDNSWRESSIIKGSSIKLPLRYNRSIGELEEKTPTNLIELWEDNFILEGEIAIPLQNGAFTLDGTAISYDEKLGLFEERGI